MTRVYEASKPTDNILETMARQVESYCAFLKKLGVHEHLEQTAWEVLQYEHAMFSRNNATLYDDALPTLDYLRGAGLKMAIISNWDTLLYNTVETLEIDGYFEEIVASHDQRVQSAKPDAAIFEYALEAVGVSSNEAIHVGGSYESDIIGAQSAGIRAILLDREGTQDGRWGEIIHSLHTLPDLLK